MEVSGNGCSVPVVKERMVGIKVKINSRPAIVAAGGREVKRRAKC